MGKMSGRRAGYPPYFPRKWIIAKNKAGYPPYFPEKWIIAENKAG